MLILHSFFLDQEQQVLVNHYFQRRIRLVFRVLHFHFFKHQELKWVDWHWHEEYHQQLCNLSFTKLILYFHRRVHCNDQLMLYFLLKEQHSSSRFIKRYRLIQWFWHLFVWHFRLTHLNRLSFYLNYS